MYVVYIKKVKSTDSYTSSIIYNRCTCTKYKNGYSHGSKVADVRRMNDITTMSTITV